MSKAISNDLTVQGESQTKVETSICICREKFNHILSEVLGGGNREAHEVEISILRRMMELGFLLLNLFFVNQNQGNYGETIKTKKGIAKRGRVGKRSYFSIFGKLKVHRYLYYIGDEGFAPLDILLNMPKRCYSYFLSELVNLLNIKGAYSEGAALLKKFFNLTLSVSAQETISDESSIYYEDYYDLKKTLPKPRKRGDLTVVSFDGKGVPMIKKEAVKIKGRKGKGEKRQKKKESLVGVKYTVNSNIRTDEEVANNLVFPEKKENTQKREKAQDIRYIASIECPKKKVMEEIKQEVEDEDFTTKPLICVMDGAKCIWSIFSDVFKDIKKKILILDIIHVLEYIWLIAHVKHKEGSEEARHYAYKKLLLILKGKVSSYIMELQKDNLSGSWEKSQRKKFSKVITYLKNHKQYMRYDLYLSNGYPIGTGVVESACSHVVKDRMELSGARWGICGAEAILKLRSVVKSNVWDKYWKFYTTHARDYDFFPVGGKSLNFQQKLAA